MAVNKPSLGRNLVKLHLLAGVTAWLLPTAGVAQEASNQDEASSASADITIEEVVITGTSKARRGFSSPLSVSRLDEQQLQYRSSSSQADILRSIPSIKAEGGGGEVAANVFIKGLPSGGQFQFTPLQYDGHSVINVFDNRISAFDAYYRNDLGIERLEFVRGGVSNLFGTGSVAGIINYISKTGSDEAEGAAQIEWAERGRFRGDFATSGPLSEDNNLYYAISGFYRYDEGPIKTGFPTEGFQLRGNIKKEFADNSGSFTVYGQWIDDRVQFFLPLPLDGATRKFAIGNDGEPVRTVQTSNAEGLSYETPGGRFTTPIRDGVETKGGSIAFAFEKQFDDGWGVNAKAKWARYKHQFNLFLDGDGVVSTPETLGGFLAARGLPDLANANFTFAGSTQAVPDDYLLFPNRLLDRDRPITDFSSQLNITKDVYAGNMDHTFTLGGFFSRTDANSDDTINTYLAEFNNRPRLVNLTVTDENGDEIIVAQNGLLNNGVTFSNVNHIAERFAGYIADQIESEKFVFDVGFRIEKLVGDISREGSSSFVVDDSPNLAPDLQTVVFGNGDFDIGSVSDTEWAVALGGLYKFTDNINFYANFSRGFFFPALGSIGFNPVTGDTVPYDAEIIKQAEVGVKYSGPRFSLTADGFWAKLSDRRNVDIRNDPNNPGGVIQDVSVQSTRTFGIEVTGSVFLTDDLRFDGNITYQDHQFTENSSNEAFVGNELTRQPNLLFNTGLFYDDGRFDGALFQIFTGSNFANAANGVELGSFNLVQLEAGYRIPLTDEQSARISVGVFNLFDSQGVTEGSPRQGSDQSATGAFFTGRPVLPRRVTVRLRYDF